MNFIGPFVPPRETFEVIDCYLMSFILDKISHMVLDMQGMYHVI